MAILLYNQAQIHAILSCELKYYFCTLCLCVREVKRPHNSLCNVFSKTKRFSQLKFVLLSFLCMAEGNSDCGKRTITMKFKVIRKFAWKHADIRAAAAVSILTAFVRFINEFCIGIFASTLRHR